MRINPNKYADKIKKAIRENELPKVKFSDIDPEHMPMKRFLELKPIQQMQIINLYQKQAEKRINTLKKYHQVKSNEPQFVSENSAEYNRVKTYKTKTLADNSWAVKTLKNATTNARSGSVEDRALEFKHLKTFLNSPTSTVQGAKNEQAKRYKVEKTLFNGELSKTEKTLFWKAYNMLKEVRPNLFVDSTQEMVNELYNKIKVRGDGLRPYAFSNDYWGATDKEKINNIYKRMEEKFKEMRFS